MRNKVFITKNAKLRPFFKLLSVKSMAEKWPGCLSYSIFFLILIYKYFLLKLTIIMMDWKGLLKPKSEIKFAYHALFTSHLINYGYVVWYRHEAK